MVKRADELCPVRGTVLEESAWAFREDSFALRDGLERSCEERRIQLAMAPCLPYGQFQPSLTLLRTRHVKRANERLTVRFDEGVESS